MFTSFLDKAMAALIQRAAIFDLPACVVAEHPKKSAVTGTEAIGISHTFDLVSAVAFNSSDLIAVRFNDNSNVTVIFTSLGRPNGHQVARLRIVGAGGRRRNGISQSRKGALRKKAESLRRISQGMRETGSFSLLPITL